MQPWNFQIHKWRKVGFALGFLKTWHRQRRLLKPTSLSVKIDLKSTFQHRSQNCRLSQVVSKSFHNILGNDFLPEKQLRGLVGAVNTHDIQQNSVLQRRANIFADTCITINNACATWKVESYRARCDSIILVSAFTFTWWALAGNLSCLCRSLCFWNHWVLAKRELYTAYDLIWLLCRGHDEAVCVSTVMTGRYDVGCCCSGCRDKRSGKNEVAVLGFSAWPSFRMTKPWQLLWNSHMILIRHSTTRKDVLSTFGSQ